MAQAELDEVVGQALQASPAALEGLYRALMTTDMQAELAQLRLPVLAVQGDGDLSSPPHLTGHPTAAIPGRSKSVNRRVAAHWARRDKRLGSRQSGSIVVRAAPGG